MGRQVEFLAIGVDEDVILEEIRRTGGCLIADRTDCPEPRPLDRLGLESRVWVVRAERPIVHFERDGHGWHVDLYRSLAVEFDRGGVRIDGGPAAGRLYTPSISSSVLANDERARTFMAWADRLMSFVRRRFTRNPRTGIYEGPEARSRRWPIGPGEVPSLPHGAIKGIGHQHLDGGMISADRRARPTSDHQRSGSPLPEGIQLTRVTDETFRVAVVPFTLVDIAAEDIVRTTPVFGTSFDEIEVVERGGHSTVQASIEQAVAGEASARLRALAEDRGWRLELWLWSLVSVDVPPGVDFDEIVRDLRSVEGVRAISTVVLP